MVVASCAFDVSLYLITINTECRSPRFQGALGLFQNTTKLCRNIDSDFQERKECIFKIAESFEGFVLNYSRHHLSESTPKKEISSNSLGEWTSQSYLARNSIMSPLGMANKQSLSQ